jgi:hypothetical protein
VLLRVSDQISECLGQAGEAREQAHTEPDPKRKAAFLDMERRWMLLVESFRLVEQVQRFIDDGKTRVSPASVVDFQPRGVFDDDATRVMGEAFDAAVASFADEFHPKVIYEVIARRIITAARKGERDPNRLRDVAIGAVKRIVEDHN